MDDREQLDVGDVRDPTIGSRAPEIALAFDPARLTQARLLASMTKSELASALDLTGAAIGQFEAGVVRPRPDHLPKLSEVLDVPMEFFAAGRPYARVDAGIAHFRRLRSTRVAERSRALSYVEQVWEVVNALERWVELPDVRLPDRGTFSQKPSEAARALRNYWEIRHGPFPHLVRTMETNGIVTALMPFSQDETNRIDAFSTSRLPRPVVILTPDRAKNVYRHRFTAAHELGHILMHHDVLSGDQETEREADAFAAELLMPADDIRTEFRPRQQIHDLAALGRRWGVSMTALIYRSRELGVISDASARRAWQRASTLWKAGLIDDDPVHAFPGEIPCLIREAMAVAESDGLTVRALAAQLAWRPARVRELLGLDPARPPLRLV